MTSLARETHANPSRESHLLREDGEKEELLKARTTPIARRRERLNEPGAEKAHSPTKGD